jgi:hypothetical protein
MGLILNDSAAFAGYTLFAPMTYNITYLINNEGRLVHSWPSAYRPGQSVYLLENSQLLHTANMDNPRFRSGGRGGRIELIDWDGSLTWAFDYSSDLYCQHHDVEPLPNGNILILAWEYKTRPEAVAAGRNPALLSQNSLWPEHILEKDPETDSIVWEWHVWDHLIQDFNPARQNYGVVRDHPELIDLNFIGVGPGADWNHANTVTYNAGLDQVMLSVRHFSEIWVIDHSTTTEEARGHTGGRYGRGGDLLYRWGNPQTYRRGDSASRRLFFQHDAQWIANGLPGAGRMLVFNNGVTPIRAYSSVDELEPPVDSLGYYHLRPDSTYGPDGPRWTYQDSSCFYSEIISGCQRMGNGNTLVCEGLSGTLFEVTADTHLVWKYINPVCDTGPMFQGESIPPGSNWVFKTRRYAPGYPGFEGRNMTPDGPIERYPYSIAEPPARGEQPPGINAPPGLEVIPSPCRRQATIRFSLEREGRAELVVFDCRGGRVAILAAGVLPAGEHAYRWQTDGLPAGTYFCRLKKISGTETTRLVLAE